MKSNQAVQPGSGPAQAAPRGGQRPTVWFGLVTLAFLAVPFIAAGTLLWPAAWVYIVTILLGSAGSRLVMARANPDLVAERARSMNNQGTKDFDRILMPLITAGPSLIALVAGLNYRLHWPPVVSLAWQVVGLALLVASLALSTWAMVSNRFFSSVVRIQWDRGHEVVRSGPYGIVRHPAYASSVPAQLGMALLLASAWALLPALLIVALIVVRTALEDRTLQTELPGYREYAQQVRYRLLPGVW